MKMQMIAILCAALLSLSAFVVPVRAESSYTPVSTEEYTENNAPRIRKVYRLALGEDPALIPADDFEQDGYRFSLLDITQKNEVSVQTKEHREPVTKDSDTGDLSTNLKRLDGQKEVKTEDGFTGILELDHTSVEVKVKGYKTSTKNISSSRTYSNLSDADMSFIPKSINENGRTLTLNDVQWRTEEDWDGAPRFSAYVSYTGTATSRYATGYTVTAAYSGILSKTSCDVITYTATFGGTRLPEETPEPQPEPFPQPEPETPAPEPELVPEPESEASVETEANSSPEAEPESDAEERTDQPVREKQSIGFFSIVGAAACIFAVIKGGFWCAEKIKERL